MELLSFPIIAVAIIVLGWLFSCINVLKEYERGVIFRLGRVLPEPKGPGIIFVFKPFDSIVRVGLRVIVLDVPPQDIITKDNVTVKVNAVVYFRVFNPLNAILQVENYIYATSQLSQTTLRSILGQVELDELLSQRDKLNQELQSVLDEDTDPWGIKISKVEIKGVDLPQDMQRAMALQAEAEREKRAKIINADGEYKASEMLARAATVMSNNPITMQLRYLQTLTQISAENASTVIFPVPMEFKALFSKMLAPEAKPKA